MINPVKWLSAIRLRRIFNWVNWKLVFEFILTFFIPFLYLTNIYVAFVTPNTVKLPPLLTLFGLAVAFLGLVIWILSFISLGKSFGVLPQKQKRVKSGIYKYLNHPMYIGIWLSFLGLSLVNSSFQGLLFLFLAITPLLYIRAYFEDKKLVN